MKWFKHDSDASQDAKLMRLRHKYGMIGYGLYWCCLELVARGVSSKNINFELEHDAATIAKEWALDQLEVQEMMAYMVTLGLFEETNGMITCLKLAHRLDDTNAKNPEIKKLQNSIRNNSESLGETPKVSGQIRLDKNRIYNICRFTPPSLEEISLYCQQRSNGVDPEKFKNFYDSKGWMIGKNKMKDWKAAVRTWEKSSTKKNNNDPFTGAK